MRTVLVIGVGAGDPEQITVQAINALRRTDVVFVVDKGPADLARARDDVLARYTEHSPRVVAIPDPPRDRAAAAYRSAVEAWRSARADAWERAIAAELGEADCGAFLVWGDPALYDSTIAVLDEIRTRGTVAFDHAVIPGISSPQALAARHRVAFNRVAGAVQITTGRRLARGLPEDADDVLVMLDSDCVFARFPDLDIYWGAYVGTEDEILVAGRVGDVADEIRQRRAEARKRKGWVMDTYLLRRRSRSGE